MTPARTAQNAGDAQNARNARSAGDAQTIGDADYARGTRHIDNDHGRGVEHGHGPADLTGASLRRAESRRADLQRAGLWHVDLQRAGLRHRVDLRRVDLRHRVDLRRVDLRNPGLPQDPGLQRSNLQCLGLPGTGRKLAGRHGQPRPRASHRGLAALGAIALGIGGAFATPAAASAAPAPCEQAQRYAAQSGAQLLRLNKLNAGDATIDSRRDADGEAKSRHKNGTTDGSASSDVGVAEAKSAQVADATINAAAVTRLLDADGAPTLSKPAIQLAPPTSAKAAIQNLPDGTAGPVALGRGTLTSRAKWDPRMACGAASGDVTRAEATVTDVGIGELVRIPKKARSLSTTALEPGARTMASAGLTLQSLDLLGGAVRIKIVRQPQLTAQMSTKDGGKIRYTPPVLEVSGGSVKARRLDTAGDAIELALSDGDDAEDTDRKADAATDDSKGVAEPDAARQIGSDAATGSKQAPATSGGSTSSKRATAAPDATTGSNRMPAIAAVPDATTDTLQALATTTATPNANTGSLRTLATAATRDETTGSLRTLATTATPNAKTDPKRAPAPAAVRNVATALRPESRVAAGTDTTTVSKPESGAVAGPITDSKTATGSMQQLVAVAAPHASLLAAKLEPGAAAASNTASGATTSSTTKPGVAENESDHQGAAPPWPEPRVEPATPNAGALDGLLSGLPKLGGLTGGTPLPLPTVPGVPQVGGSAESAQVTGPGARMRISLGDLRRATSSRAIAAKATVIKIAITEAPTDGPDGYGGSNPNRSRVVLDLDVGLLEAAAVAPEPAGGVQDAVATNGGGRGLPITGPGASAIAAGGVTLLLAGLAALTVGRRRRRLRP